MKLTKDFTYETIADIKFRIRTFNLLEGFAFLDKMNSKEFTTLDNQAKILLPLALPVTNDEESKPLIEEPLTLEKLQPFFKNPLDIITLINKIFKFQILFLKDSPEFHNWMSQEKLDMILKY